MPYGDEVDVYSFIIVDQEQNLFFTIRWNIYIHIYCFYQIKKITKTSVLIISYVLVDSYNIIYIFKTNNEMIEKKNLYKSYKSL